MITWGYADTHEQTNVDRTVHISYKAIDPPGEAKSDMGAFWNPRHFLDPASEASSVDDAHRYLARLCEAYGI
jgi:hypothetical protein